MEQQLNQSRPNMTSSIWSFEMCIVMVEVKEPVDVRIVKVMNGRDLELDRERLGFVDSVVLQKCSDIEEIADSQLYTACVCRPLIETRNCGSEDICKDAKEFYLSAGS